MSWASVTIPWPASGRVPGAPWRAETFKFSTDPQLAAKVHDVVGLYLHPPERVVALCVDEKPQIQALECTQPVRPVWLDPAEQRTHDYVRHGTTTLFVALEVATGRVTDQCQPRHCHQEFLALLKLVARAYPRRQLHVVCDNYAAHKHPAVRGWLARHPRVQLHFTPTSPSWLNLVEVFFSIVERQALRRGDFASVTDLVTAISRFCTAWNERCQPFAWTKPADEIWPSSSVKPPQRPSTRKPGNCGPFARCIGGGPAALTPRIMRTKLLPCLKTTWREAAIVLRRMGVLVLVLAGGLVFTGHAIAAPDALVAVGTVGSFTTTSGASGPVGGRFTLEGFSEQDGELVAFGTVTYSLCVPNVDPKNCLATVTQPLEWAVASLAASCAELQLVLGPVDFAAFFTLPGFTIHFDQASLAVSPEPGPAANLLCALAHRLEAGGAAGPLAPMLTQLVRLLGDP